MSYDTDRYNLNKLRLPELYLLSCGITENHPYHTSGVRVYHEYSLHFITKGKGTYLCKGKRYSLEKGQGFLLVPGVPNEYIGDGEDPWSYIYISFSGKDAELLLQEIGLSAENLTFSFPEELISRLYALHAAGKERALKGYGFLGEFLAVIGTLAVKDQPRPQWSPALYVKKAKRFIRDNYAYDINVENVAANVGVDRTYLYRLFVKYEGITPSAFILNTRLEAAAHRLRETTDSIGTVALACGFTDASHFHKAFFAKYKVAPKKYKNGSL